MWALCGAIWQLADGPYNREVEAEVRGLVRRLRLVSFSSHFE